MTWPLDPMTLMWIQVTTGAMGMLTLVYLWRIVVRKLGYVQDVEVYFSPQGGCQAAIVRELMKAKSEILVQAYSFTAEPADVRAGRGQEGRRDRDIVAGQKQ